MPFPVFQKVDQEGGGVSREGLFEMCLTHDEVQERVHGVANCLPESSTGKHLFPLVGIYAGETQAPVHQDSWAPRRTFQQPYL